MSDPTLGSRPVLGSARLSGLACHLASSAVVVLAGLHSGTRSEGAMALAHRVLWQAPGWALARTVTGVVLLVLAGREGADRRDRVRILARLYVRPVVVLVGLLAAGVLGLNLVEGLGGFVSGA